MKPNNESYTPDEAALKASLEQLAQTIQPDAQFIANLEAQLQQKSSAANRRRIFWSRALAAALVVILVALYFSRDTTPEIFVSSTPSTDVAVVSTATFPTLEIDFSATAGPVIRSTATSPPPRFDEAVLERWLTQVKEFLEKIRQQIFING